TLLRKPHVLRRFTRLPEHVDRNSATRIPVGTDPQPFRGEQVDDAFGDMDRAVLVEGAVIAERVQEELQRLRFHQIRIWNIIDDDMREVRLAGHRAERGEFRCGKAHDIIRAPVAVRHFLEDGRFRALRRLHGLPELQKTRYVCHAHLGVPSTLTLIPCARSPSGSTWMARLAPGIAALIASSRRSQISCASATAIPAGTTRWQSMKAAAPARRVRRSWTSSEPAQLARIAARIAASSSGVTALSIRPPTEFEITPQP